jgi:hypothetical protein
MNTDTAIRADEGDMQGNGDYTAERERLLADVTMEDFEAYVERSRKKAAE